MKKLLIILLILIPQSAFGIVSKDFHAVQFDTAFYDETDGGSGSIGCTTNGGPTLDGHTLPAAHGGVGVEEAINEAGQVASTGGKVTFSGNAALGQNYRDYYITMRWRYVLWNWNGTSAKGPEDVAFYSKAPRVLVTNPRTGKSIITVIMEAGPAPWTGVDRSSNNDPKQGWVNPQDGTPSTYKGRVAGLPPTAIQALGAQMRLADGSGDELVYSWAPDQAAQPGPVNVAVNAVVPDSANASACSGGLGIDAAGFVFPQVTTKTSIKAGSSYSGQTLVWCYASQTSCHHDYVAADIFNPIGTANVAAVGGTVIKAVDTTCSGGFEVPRVQIKGVDGKYYYYTHMKPGSIKVTTGQVLKAGDPLGVVGPPECAENTAPHLHFQVSSGPVNSTKDLNERKEYIDPQPVLLSAFAKLPE
ncbi:MAG: M23 family metallopeptidase [Candidatus Saccharibacteria bacterium]